MSLRKKWLLSMLAVVLGGSLLEIVISRQIAAWGAAFNAEAWLASTSGPRRAPIDDDLAATLARTGRFLAELPALRDAIRRRDRAALATLVAASQVEIDAWALVDTDGAAWADGADGCDLAAAGTGFTLCGRHPHVVSGTALPDGGRLFLARRLDERYVDRLRAFSEAEVLLVGPDGAIASSAFDDAGRRLVPTPDPGLTRRLADGADHFGLHPLGLAGYRGYRAYDGRIFGRGAADVPSFAYVSPLAPKAPAFPVRLIMWVPERVMTVGILYSTLMMTAGTLLVLVVLSVVIWRLVRRLTRPLDRLTRATARVAAGDLTVVVPPSGEREVDEVARAFNHMTRQLELTQSRLVQSEKMNTIGRLAGGIAHEINNPLGVILGFAQGLDKRIGDDDPLKKPVSWILREAIRCRNLVQDLLVFSRTAARTQEPVDLPALLDETLPLLEARAKTQAVEIVREVAAGLPPLIGNRTQLQQIMLNLGTNALDAMPDGGTLTIRLGAEAREALLVFEDTGDGMSPEVCARIFEPFFTTKEVGAGTGLGLSLVNEIVHRHGGRVDVESGVGRGTTMTVRLAAGGSPA